MLIQIYTSYIRLVLFLYKIRVLGVELVIYQYREGDKTLEHVTLQCPKEENKDKNKDKKSNNLKEGSKLISFVTAFIVEAPYTLYKL